MLAIPFALLSGMILTGIGRLFILRLDRETRLSQGEQLVCSFLIGALVLHFCVQAIGHIWLNAISMGALGIGLAMVALYGFRGFSWRLLARGLTALPRLPLLLLLGVSLLSFLQGLAPPNDYDSLMYHLAVPKTDIERGLIAPDWMRALPSAFFPHLVTSLVRFSLAVAGENATQPGVALFGLAAIAATGLLARRIDLSPTAALWASLLFAAIRLNIWEMGTVEVDLPLAASSVAALLVYLESRDRPDWRMMALLGLMLGIGFNIKYQGGLVALAFAPLLLLDWQRGRATFSSLIAMGATALGVFAPHLLENHFLTGDPVFPLYFSKIFQGGAAFYDTYNQTYGPGRGLLDLLTEPWLIFAAPMQYFDGMVLGAPYLLALLPGIFIGWRQLRGTPALVALILAYYLLWFYMQSQQVRFHAPILPMLSVLAAGGATFLWQACQGRVVKALAVSLFALLFFNQTLFVGIYAALRLPVALGMMSAADYHARTPTLQGAFYPTCRFISENLKPGERYLSLLIPHSYYCPQMASVQKVFDDENKNWLWANWPHKIDFPDFVARMEIYDIRFVIVPVAVENRRNDTGEQIITPIDLESFRFGPFVGPALANLQPVAGEPRSAVYDGRQVQANLRKMLASGIYPQDAR